MKVRPALILLERNHILLMQYRYGEQDVYALPGGNPDKGETMVETVRRELEEELGISVEVGPIAFTGEVTMPDSKEDVLHVVFLGELIGGLPQLNPEQTTALAVVWKPLTSLHTIQMYPNVGQHIQQCLVEPAPLAYVGKIDQQFF